MDGVVTKPLNLRVLMQEIAAVLDNGGAGGRAGRIGASSCGEGAVVESFDELHSAIKA
jgi:hypothetical protein